MDEAQENFDRSATRENLFKARTLIASISEQDDAARVILGAALNIAERRGQILRMERDGTDF